MASNLSSIGFSMETEEDLHRLLLRALEQGESLPVAEGTYLRWSPGSGAELWLQIDRDEAIVGFNPHFGGDAAMRVGLTATVARPEGSALDGAFHGWANPADPADGGSGDYPFVFDAPDFALHGDLALPAVVDVRIAAFAHALEAYAGEAEYSDAQQGGIKFASESFIPSGLFTSAEGGSDPPAAHAVFTGRVLATALRTNPVTGVPFHWARVRTLGGEVDVVADPEILAGALVENGVVQGAFWLSGRCVRSG